MTVRSGCTQRHAIAARAARCHPAAHHVLGTSDSVSAYTSRSKLPAAQHNAAPQLLLRTCCPCEPPVLADIAIISRGAGLSGKRTAVLEQGEEGDGRRDLPDDRLDLRHHLLLRPLLSAPTGGTCDSSRQHGDHTSAQACQCRRCCHDLWRPRLLLRALTAHVTSGCPGRDTFRCPSNECSRASRGGDGGGVGQDVEGPPLLHLPGHAAGDHHDHLLQLPRQQPICAFLEHESWLPAAVRSACCNAMCRTCQRRHV